MAELTTKILDCTIRDGGHLTGWNFPDEVVAASFEAAGKSGIDYFEIGYLNGVGGKFAQCSSLSGILGAKGSVKVAAMVNAGGRAYSIPENGFIDAVRIACHPDETEIGLHICEEFASKGFEVFLHLMNISGMDDAHFSMLSGWSNKEILSSVYFADSFGSLIPADIEKYFSRLKLSGFNKISFHAHNNMQMAFANTLCAINCGAYSVDVTAYGMGRGSGNLPAELLLGYLNRNPVFYLELIEKYYLELFEKYRWGYSVPNLIGGLKNLHPRKINELSAYSFSQMWQKSDI